MKNLILALAFLMPAVAQAQSGLAKATFAGGCVWCVEEAFEKLPGVTAAVSGYMDGRTQNPTYEQVASGSTGHTEVVEVTYEPAKISYERLLQHFWINHDPTKIDRQFCDGGSQYRPGIYWHTEEQRTLAEASKAKWEKDKPFKEKILTPVVKAQQFWPAESYHQDYYKKNPARYQFYVSSCGRYTRLDQLWGKLRK